MVEIDISKSRFHLKNRSFAFANAKELINILTSSEQESFANGERTNWLIYTNGRQWHTENSRRWGPLYLGFGTMSLFSAWLSDDVTTMFNGAPTR